MLKRTHSLLSLLLTLTLTLTLVHASVEETTQCGPDSHCEASVDDVEAAVETPQIKGGKGPTIVYFDGRGRAEVARMLLADNLGKSGWEDWRVGAKDTWNELKHSGLPPFKQLPVLLEDEGGWKLSQSGAIERYLARKYNLMGETAREEARVNEIVGGVGDMQFRHKNLFRNGNEEQKQKWLEEEVPFFAGVFESFLGEKDYFLGENLSLAEYKFCNFVDSSAEVVYEHSEALSKLCKERFFTRPGIADWVAHRKLTEF